MKVLLRFIVVFLLPTCLHAQPQYVFNRISNREGLVSNYVYSIIQDRKGFWWFGTANGLQRYDGRKIIMFKAGPDTEDYLPSQAISQLFEDKSGKFWVRCGSEVGLFDPTTFRYRRATIKITGEVAPRAEYSLWQSPDGQVIVTIRNHGFYTYDSSSHSFHAGRNPFKLPNGWLPIRFTDDAGTGRYWIVADSGLSLFDPIQKKLFNRLNNPEHIQLFHQERLNKHITSFFVDHSRRAWIVTWLPHQPKENFYCYDLNANILLPDTMGMAAPTSRYHELQTFFEQTNGTVWGFGKMLLLQQDRERKRFSYIRNEHTDDYGLKYDELLCMYEDREKNIWLGTDQGVYVFNPAVQSFNSVSLVKKDEDQAVDRTATSFLETKSGEIWTSTWGSGIVAYDQNLQLLGNRLMGTESKKDENFSRVWSLSQHSASGIIWAGCQSGRLILYDPKSGHTRYTTVPLMEEKTIRQVVEDKNGNIWLGSQYGHLVKWDPRSNSFDAGFSLVQNIGTIIYRMMIDNKGNLWIATHLKGIYKVDPSTGKILMHYTKRADPKISLFSDFASDIAQLNDTTILVVTGALNVIHTGTGAVRKITVADGLPANNINSIAVDEQQGIWLGLLGHLTRFNLRKNIFTSFSQKDGVLNANFQSGAALKISGDRMLFGTSSDILYFRPRDVRPSVAPPDVNITDFK
ncbi:MAG TPA: two-component regulator propeller domain-containing protein, partial [Flavitalea sp.]|nr:two-component regulator propeller domain-containing protein [Flavitalea sp.]